MLVGDAEAVSVDISSTGIKVMDVSLSAPTKTGYTFVYWLPVSSTYRWVPLGIGGSRFYYYVGTAYATAMTAVFYPVYRKNA